LPLLAFLTVAVVIRAYNNNPSVIKAVERCLKHGVGLIIVIVKDEDESIRGNVRSWLADLSKANPGRIVIIEMRVGYSWSNALNQGVEYIRLQNLVRLAANAGPRFDFVLNMSVEVLWDVEHLDKMLSAVTHGADLVGTTFKGVQN